MSLLALTLADWMPLPVVISLLVLGTLAFGLIAPNAMQGAMQPLPQIAGAAGAATGCIQMTMGAVASGLVAALYDGHSALSMTALMALCSLLAFVSYLLLARPASASSCRLERRYHPPVAFLFSTRCPMNANDEAHGRLTGFACQQTWRVLQNSCVLRVL